MESTYEYLVSKAYDYVNYCAEKYEEGDGFGYVVLLNGNYEIKARPDDPENCHAILEAIHLYQKNNPTKPVKEGFEKGFRTLSSLACTYNVFNNLIKVLQYEIEKEMEKTNSFTIDVKGLLDDLKMNIQKNRKYILERCGGFDEWFQNKNEYLENKLGNKSK